MSSRRALATIGLVFLVLLTPSRFAGAQTCVTDGTALRTGSTANGLPQLVADGAGGSFVAWADSRNGNYDIFVARVSSSGSISWGPTNICSATGDQKNPHVAADGSGGFFVAWEDGRTTANGKDIYVQRVTSTGSIASGWTSNGIAIVASTNDQEKPVVASDGAGGALIGYIHTSSFVSYAYVQRINSSGTALWSGSGKQVASNIDYFAGMSVVCDGAAGAYVGYKAGNTLWIQRLAASNGALQWTGTKGQLTTNGDRLPALVQDGTGIFAAYASFVSGSNTDIYAVDLLSSGNVSWSATPCNDTATQVMPRAAADGTGGFIVTWVDGRNGGTDLYAHHLVSQALDAAWTTNGVLVRSGLQNPNIENICEVTGDGRGGGIAAYAGSDNHIYGRHLGCGGALDTEVGICTATGTQVYLGFASTGSGTAMAAWTDSRTSGSLTSGVYVNCISYPLPSAPSLGVANGTHMQAATWSDAASDPVLGAPVSYDLRTAAEPVIDCNFDAATTIGTYSAGSSTYCVPIYSLDSCTPYSYGLRTNYASGVSKVSSRTSSTKCSGEITVECGGSSMRPTREGRAESATFTLSAPSPSPASVSTTLRWSISPDLVGRPLRLLVLDVSGRLIRQLAAGAARSGETSASWDLADAQGAKVPRGVYFVRLGAGHRSLTRTLIVQR